MAFVKELNFIYKHFPDWILIVISDIQVANPGYQRRKTRNVIDWPEGNEFTTYAYKQSMQQNGCACGFAHHTYRIYTWFDGRSYFVDSHMDPGMRTHGKGSIARVRNASRQDAHCNPNRLYTGYGQIVWATTQCWLSRFWLTLSTKQWEDTGERRSSKTVRGQCTGGIPRVCIDKKCKYAGINENGSM